MKCPGGHSTVRCWSVASRGGEPRHHSRSRAELALNNQQSPINQSVTNLAILNNGTNADIISTNIGSAFLPKTPEVFSHDADGNLLLDGQWTNTWNGENRLVALESTAASVSAGAPRQKVEWSYLPDGRWSQRVVSLWSGGAWVDQSTNRFLWDGVVLLAVLNGNNAVQQAYMRGTDLSGSPAGAGGVGGLLAVTIHDSQITTHFAAYDGNGNVVGLVSTADGTESARYEYSPFGETLRATGPMALVNSLHFSTQFAEDVTGHVKYLYRAYNPELGRWLRRDPLSSLDSSIEHGAFQNAPLNFLDYLGLTAYRIEPDVTDDKEEDPRFKADKNIGAYTEAKWTKKAWKWEDCPCSSERKLISIELELVIQVHYRKGKTPNDPQYKMTFGQHEQEHVNIDKAAAENIESHWKAWIGPCRKPACAAAIAQEMDKYFAYKDSRKDYYNADFDCIYNDQSNPNGKYCKRKDQLKTASDKLFNDWDAALTAVVAACSQ